MWIVYCSAVGGIANSDNTAICRDVGHYGHLSSKINGKSLVRVLYAVTRCNGGVGEWFIPAVLKTADR